MATRYIALKTPTPGGLLAWLLLFGCTFALAWSSASLGEEAHANGFDVGGALVPQDEILEGGPPRDGIPALTTPRFVAAADATFLRADDSVLGVSLRGVTKAYPVRILNWHEIINDEIAGEPVAVSFCPLCGTGAAFYAQVRGRRLTFGVSGLLYNSNLLLYDKETLSLWSQLMNKAISGSLKGTQLESLPVTQTTWKSWRQAHPDTLVLSDRTGYRRDYASNPYADYMTSAMLMFRVSKESHRFQPKEWVLGVAANGEYKAYPFSELARAGAVVHDHVGGQLLEIRFDPVARSAQAFSAGKPYPGQMAYWFAWFAFHPNTEVFQVSRPAAK
ncbi:MAG: DUF3179 domain-containing protein [Paraburkholderia sp.]|uniref:DUF3179 domain-containing protein n=1 Tax=Paraburkholderia sp. TaxID=1926495 RepID=UPI00121A92AD|nr:DUF3179 domain-containing protein [Paraburkholderia sp.]TAM08548.1 MAG: DUF3179 domain-containing protein [Paraburkholderia sp.]